MIAVVAPRLPDARRDDVHHRKESTVGASRTSRTSRLGGSVEAVRGALAGWKP